MAVYRAAKAGSATVVIDAASSAKLIPDIAVFIVPNTAIVDVTVWIS